MKQKYQVGEIVYFVRSMLWVEEVKILRFGSGFYTIKNEQGSGTRVRESKLYKTKEEAEHVVERNKMR